MICVTGKRLALSAVAMLLALLCGTAAGRAAEPPAALSPDEMRLGERMYREGVLPSGAPMKAFVSGDVPVDGTAFTCVSCHLHSGLGSFEGEVVTPPTNGRVLYQERKPFIPGSEFIPSISNYAKHLPVRPAYTDETLASLIATGIDPTGRSVLYVMPRYELGDREMAILIAYLKALSDKPSPGVGASEIKFATVIVDGTDPVAVDSMLTPIQFSIDRKNSLALAARKNYRVARMAYNMLGDLHSMTFSLSRWILRGPPETWRAQLDQYYRNEPVFALLGGISGGEWEPVHRFCEENRIPSLFPVVDYPVISDSDWYTLYFSRGVRQEGEAAARYLNGMAGLFNSRPVVQIIRETRKGETLADGFRATWQQSGHAAPLDIRLPKGERLTDKRVREILDTHRPAALLVWDDDSALPALAGAAAGQEEQPTVLLASGTYLGKTLWTIPEPLRERLYLTYPYRLPQEDVRFDIAVKKVLPGKDIQSFDQKIIRESFIAAEVLGKAFMEMRAEYYRDFLMDTIGMMTDMYYPLYERVSFGPGQRYASKGCYIVQLGKGESPKLERRSEWVIP